MERLTESLHDLVEQWRWGVVVKTLMTLRGIDRVSAAMLVAELADLRRLAHARGLMGFVGLVPTEHSSGDSGSPGRPAPDNSRDCLAGPSTIELTLPGAQGAAGCAQQDLRGAGPGTDRFRVVDRPTG